MKEIGKILLFGLFVGFVLAWFILHQIAGFTFPLPWPDEVVFFYSAKNFSEFHTFLVPELNPERVLRWFPPGFSVIFGSLQTLLTDGTFENARILVGILIVEAFLMLCIFCWRLKARYTSIFLCLGALFSMHTVIAGNIIRPEALVMFLFASGLALSAWRQDLIAICFYLLAPLVHPVAIMATLPCLIISFIYLDQARDVKNWWKWVLLGCVLACYVIFIVDEYRFSYYAKNDFIFQMNNRSALLLKKSFMQNNNWIGLICGSILLIYALIARQRLIIILSIAALGLLFMRIVGQGYWYGIYRRAAIILICLGLLEALNVIWLKYFDNKWQGAFNFLSVLVVGEVLLLIGAVNPYYQHWQWEGMSIAPNPSKSSYLSAFEMAEVRHKVDSISEVAAPGNIVFYPAGDMCFFDNLLPSEQKPIMPVFVTPVPSMVVFHNSKLHTELMKTEGLEWLRQYLPYISDISGFATKEGNMFTIFVLQSKPRVSYKFNPRLLYPNSLTNFKK